MSSDDEDADDNDQDCDKNPGHDTFLTLDQCLNLDSKFMQSLPSIYHGDIDLIKNLIKSLADLTVKVLSGNSMGTGFILKVTESTHDGTSLEPSCRCDNCGRMNKPNSVVGKIYVRTAEHVVIDKDTDKFKSTRCHLFYNSKGSDVVDVVAVKLKKRNKNDTVCIVCATCQSKHLKSLRKSLNKFRDIKQTVNYKFNTRRNPKDSVVIVVSHPHGRHKHVTIGPYFPIPGTTQKEYKADTCSGSSGAYVFPLGCSDDTGPVVHSGYQEKDGKIFGVGNSYPDLNNLKLESFFQNILSRCRNIVNYLNIFKREKSCT